MANKKSNFNSLNLPSIDKAPNFVPASKVQLTQGQANELLGNKPQLRGEVPDATVSNSSNISSNDVASQLTPMQRYKIAEIIGLPKDYQPTPYQHDPATLARAQQFMQALSSYQPSQQQMMNDYNRSMTNKYLAGALGATPIEQKTPLDIQKEYINNLYDVYTKQHDMEKASNEQAQLDSISKALGIPVDSMEHFYKNIMNPSLTAYSQFSNQQLKGQQASNLQTQKDTTITPQEQADIDWKKANTRKVNNEIDNPKPPALSPADAKSLNDYVTKASAMPSLIRINNELKQLSKTANYTEISRVMNDWRRQLGQPVDRGQVDREKYEAIINNELFPLLKKTLGAQFTQIEGEKFIRTLGDPHRSPAEKQAILDAFMSTQESQLENSKRVLDMMGIQVPNNISSGGGIPIGKTQRNSRTGQIRVWDGSQWQIK